jgi:hypothetical protein
MRGKLKEVGVTVGQKINRPLKVIITFEGMFILYLNLEFNLNLIVSVEYVKFLYKKSMQVLRFADLTNFVILLLFVNKSLF